MNAQTPSKEACETCPAPEAGTAPSNQDSGLTYDEGGGVKDRVVISGPLSEVISQQLNVIFKKRPLTLVEDMPEPATESHVNDLAVQEAFQAAKDHPDNTVILASYDVKSIKEHMERMTTGNATQDDLSAVTTVPIVAATPDQLLDGPLINEYSLSSSDELLVVTKVDPLATGPDASSHDFVVRQPSKLIAQALRMEGDLVNVKTDPSEPTLLEKCEAIERLYAGQVKRIHFGVESLIKSLGARRVAK